MSAFYGQVFGASESTASRRGNDSIKVSAQSWHGSIITRMWYNGGVLMTELQYSDGSDSTGYTLFYGTFEELKGRLSHGNGSTETSGSQV